MISYVRRAWLKIIHDIIESFRLDRPNMINSMQVSSAENIFINFTDVKARLYVRDDTTLRFLRPRTVLYALRIKSAWNFND